MAVLEQPLQLRSQFMDLHRGRRLSIDNLQKRFASNQLCYRKRNQNAFRLNLRLAERRHSFGKRANHRATKLIDAQHFTQLQSGISLDNRVGYEANFRSGKKVLFVEIAAGCDL